MLLLLLFCVFLLLGTPSHHDTTFLPPSVPFVRIISYRNRRTPIINLAPARLSGGSRRTSTRISSKPGKSGTDTCIAHSPIHIHRRKRIPTTPELTSGAPRGNSNNSNNNDDAPVWDGLRVHKFLHVAQTLKQNLCVFFSPDPIRIVTYDDKNSDSSGEKGGGGDGVWVSI